MDDSDLHPWHQALAYAVTGVRFQHLGRQPRPDLDTLTALLRAVLGAGVDPAELTRAHPVPADLTEGLGAAQLGAAVAELRRRLTGPPRATVAGARPLTADERRLLQDVPPHHGR